MSKLLAMLPENTFSVFSFLSAVLFVVPLLASFVLELCRVDKDLVGVLIIAYYVSLVLFLISFVVAKYVL